ncbi:3-isopropylmalate dehydrogenase [Lutibacter sp. HS1-25]|uniref:3-isopropylmalate dehydrogenase n=1 Tax=Lutibacter sp. HS1-25 TaxID=2485000 RepID=UPI0010109252|nr:3-isopropylmalate dehydrogenase [Lutibacter sp. HS1-25]RXP60332.1 3-isopropylmalate dehydrogenase [Lutibacter sp. HS1-25]
MNLKIALLPGDGIGPEVIQQAVKVLDAIAEKYTHKFEYTKAAIGAVAIEKTGNPLPNETLQICTNSDAILLGTIADLKYNKNSKATILAEQGLLDLRKSLGLFANIRPLTTYNSLIHNSNLKEKVIKGTDFIIYRELTGGIYFSDKTLSEDGKTASDICKYNINEIDRIAHLAFNAARIRRKKLTLVDKASVLETSRLWRKRISEISKSYPNVKLNFMFADDAAKQLILNPKQFDIILTENLFGDILSDEASVISGSIGLLASASIGEKSALFEPIQNYSPLDKGKNIANPLASILAAAMLLDHFKLYEEAEDIRTAVEKSLELSISTPDLNETNHFSTTSVGNFLCDFILDDENTFYNKNNIDLGQSTII